MGRKWGEAETGGRSETAGRWPTGTWVSVDWAGEPSGHLGVRPGQLTFKAEGQAAAALTSARNHPTSS